MIGSVSGTVIFLTENSAIIETASGIGYRVFIGAQPLNNGQAVRLYTYNHVREEANDLYGFLAPEDLRVFELLLSVSGVGPKSAQTILTTLKRDQVIDAVASNQPAIFKSVSGVGQKVAEKIIVELKSKVGALGNGSLGGDENGQLFDALLNFGYTQNQILPIMKELDPSLTMAEKLKQALRLLAK